jgi:short-subunit dehydrogenase
VNKSVEELKQKYNNIFVKGIAADLTDINDANRLYEEASVDELIM